ncbi:alpha-2-macroglobulin family protein [Catalinimonas niigatensis]|uniref:alpha-2-macroglobulin family protein n=1 Tax=Catalinimonas niigatensis TaxID=1397264 RepID=UPI002666B5B5|nr:MG2 domain-containing protein [Catalinimonas niigatensis]WPP48994.1 MG2 domain-containing protein [Catalinimonas niigatensis]
MDTVKAFFLQLISRISSWYSNVSSWLYAWYSHASWRERGIAGGGVLVVLVLFVWLISLFSDEDFRGTEEVDEAYSAYISGYTAGIISSESSIRIQFNRPLADSTQLGKEVKKKYFSFNPSIQGKTYWLDPSTLEFIPEQKLQSGQQYQVKFALDELIDVPDELESFEYTLRTMQQNYDLQISGLTYEDREDLAKPVLVGTLLTADMAEASAIESMLTAVQDDNPLEIDWEHMSGTQTHQFTVRNISRLSGEATVRLTSNGEPIAVDKKDEIEIPVPAVGQFSLIGNRVIEEPEQYVELRFSDPLQENQSLEGLVQIRQEGEGESRWIIDNNILRVYPANAITGHSTLVINEGVKNTEGERLEQTTEVDVFFEPVKPAIRFVNQGVVLPSTDGMMLPFEAVNLKAVDVTIVKIFEDNLSQFFQVNQFDGEQEIRRVARPVAQKKIPLNASGATDLSKWNRFTLDLSKIIQADPGALYQVVLSFHHSQSLYDCGTANNVEENDLTAYDLAKDWDDPSKIYWDAYNQYYYAPDFNWEERENPCSPSYYGFRRSAKTNLLASDLGIIAKRGENDQLYVAVTNLRTTEPLSGVDVRLYDFQQRLITEGSTDGDGELMIMSERQPYLLVASEGGQRGYLRVDDGSSLSLSSFEVAGQEVSNGIKGFIYGDRGVWRPGDSLHINFVLEDRAKTLPPNHPVIFQLENPRGQVVQRIVRTNAVGNIYNFSTATDADALTGNWTANVQVGGATFTKNLRIETVRPNRLKIDLDFRTDRFVARNSRPTGQLNVSWLSGANARNLRAEFEIQLSPGRTAFDDYPNHTFEDEARNFSGERREVFDSRIDEEGRASFDVDLSLEQEVPGVLNATFFGRVYEEGGNFSIDRFTIPYYPYSSFVGMDVPQGEGMGGALLTGESHQVSLVVVDERGQLLNRRELEMSLYKLDWRWWWEQSGNYIANYVGNEYQEPVLQETISINSGKTNWSFSVEEEAWGRYYLRACDPESGHCTGEVVYLDWPEYAGRDGRNAPQAAAMLSFSADKASYQVGEEARISIPAKGEGRALVSIEDGTEVLKTYWVELEEEGETAFELEIEENMTPNIYVHVSLLQPHAQTVNDLPIRMYGVIPLEVTDPDTYLEPVISMPEKIEPEGEVIITVSEANEKPMAYTIAMVDEGLLDITNFETPSPHDYFYAHEALGVKTWDMYDYVIGAYGGKLERILAIGGDEAGRGEGSRRANRFQPVVKFLGPFFLEEDEQNIHTIRMPNYVGSVRTMVVAAYEGAYGQAEQTTPVSKPLMILGTLPRVLSPGESLKLPVDIFAMDNSVKSVRVSVNTSDLISLQGKNSEEMFFANPGDRIVDFGLSVSEQVGIGKVEINAAAGPIRADYNVEIDVRNPNPPVTTAISTLVGAGENWEASFEAVGMAGTNEAVIELSDIPPLNLGKRLAYLISYPHGCIEQTVSAAFPQLYLSNVQELSEQEQQRIEAHINQAIKRINAFRTNEGAFAYWPGSNDADEWSTSYAGHFLLEAQQKGYFVPPGILQSWISYQKRRATQWGRSQQYTREDLIQAYRLYTLALAGQEEQGAMNRMRELTDLGVAAQWRLAAAYALLEQNDVAETLITGLGNEVNNYRETAGTYGSALRDEAMILETLALMNQREKGLALFRRLSSALSNEDNWMSTQTTAYALLATTKFAEGMQLGEGINASIEIDGQPAVNLQSELSVVQRPVEMNGRNEHQVKVVNQSGGELYARVILRGKPALGNESAMQNGLQMNVVYKGVNGEAIDIEDLKQGTDFVAEVMVHNPGTEGSIQQLALSHIIPSGWEILNTRLLDMDQFNRQSDFEYQDIRDDRVFTYFDLAAGERKTFRVMLNASYIGRFYQPAIYCEAMYDNTINAGMAGEWIEVVEP